MTISEFKDFLDNLAEDYYSYMLENSEINNYSAAIRCQAKAEVVNCIIRNFAEVEFSKKPKHNDFSWDNVNIGDKCIYNNNCTGTVARLIFDSESYCCGMVVNFSDESDYKWATVYQDDEYKNLKQIGSWVHE